MSYATMKKDNRYLNVNVNGNKKLKNTDHVRFIIWNLPAKTTCPYATEHCKKACYACKAERAYPNVLKSRMANFEKSKSDTFVNDMIFTIAAERSTKKYDGKKIVFRIHESGDFYNLEYAAKWVAIAKQFLPNEDIVFVAYTKSIEYFVKLGYGTVAFPENLHIISSLWDDTPADMVKMTYRNDFPIYTALSGEDMEREKQSGHIFHECRCEDCASCGKCWDKSEREIIVRIH